MSRLHDLEIPLTISNLQQQYKQGMLSPRDVVEVIIAELKARGDDGIWIYKLPEENLRSRVLSLENNTDKAFPLWGIPFSIKDCIDVAGLPTSAGCPGFVYTATHTNPAVQNLLDAGAILIGKTNLDQFATGLVGIRTGYTAPHNAFSKDYIPGGSSSGSALSVAVGLVSFSLGTDTGGSGRVPAGFNNIVGLKPTKGLLSTAYTVEACKTLDCISIFTLTSEDAQTVFETALSYDPAHSFSRPMDEPPPRLREYKPKQPFRFGVPRSSQREFFGNEDVDRLYEGAIATLTKMGGICQEIDYAPFLEANDLLFNGPWVAERYASVGSFVETMPEAVFPTTRKILSKAKKITAVEAFEGLYAVEAIKRKSQPLWDEIDFLVVPTTGTIYRIDEVEAEPLRLNANLGYYTNFVNLLDLCALALPLPWESALPNRRQSNRLPSGLTLIARPYSEPYLVELGKAFRCASNHDQNHHLGATSFTLPIQM
ncbi:Amidase, putative [Synechococcus sp. PCC 7335]|uniref:allophanate hydrolase n=1 Tax=Synechococcus sp. (strain ATCC 29403 / PCC 7335) TaxID=91464 RepID=UPI00017EB4DD|nr:allophanate hydrolase [Synechococcus sp. PCC 7335]EDX84570.1 Amidase, putative [Synechococcus sp. PCC 7335]